MPDTTSTKKVASSAFYNPGIKEVFFVVVRNIHMGFVNKLFYF